MIVYALIDPRDERVRYIGKLRVRGLLLSGDAIGLVGDTVLSVRRLLRGQT